MGWARGGSLGEMSASSQLDKEGNPPCLAVSPLQSSFKLPRLPVLAVQKVSAEAGG